MFHPLRLVEEALFDETGAMKPVEAAPVSVVVRATYVLGGAGWILVDQVVRPRGEFGASPDWGTLRVNVIHVMGEREEGSPDGQTCDEHEGRLPVVARSEQEPGLVYHPYARPSVNGWWCPICCEHAGWAGSA